MRAKIIVIIIAVIVFIGLFTIAYYPYLQTTTINDDQQQTPPPQKRGSTNTALDYHSFENTLKIGILLIVLVYHGITIIDARFRINDIRIRCTHF
jgi:hypothetical protein